MDLNAISNVLKTAAALPAGNKNGMRISLSGVISHGARALQDMSQPLLDTTEQATEQFDERLQEVQPAVHAHALEMLSKHISLLQGALKNGDAAIVRQFIDLYVID
jgi:hypothetical protein